MHWIYPLRCLHLLLRWYLHVMSTLNLNHSLDQMKL
jgi:hypothetical protein